MEWLAKLTAKHPELVVLAKRLLGALLAAVLFGDAPAVEVARAALLGL